MPASLKFLVVVLFALIMWGVSWFFHDVIGPHWSAVVDQMPTWVNALGCLGLIGAAVWAIRHEAHIRKPQRPN